jgi:tetratricopeptide (TPR) repeat protein
VDLAQVEQIKMYLAHEKILVVEPSSSFSQIIASTLIELGAKSENIIVCKRFKDAFQALFAHKPRILLTEFFVDDRQGLSLVEIQSQFFDDSARIAALITHNSSDSAVAEAAEGHVDAYLLKPFSIGGLQERLVKLILKKTNPTDYEKKIRQGKALLVLGEFEKALAQFAEAAALSDKPSLACYYEGKTHLMQHEFVKAEDVFGEGLRIKPRHYKCLLGLFDATSQQKNFKKAYEIATALQDSYPVNQQRLSDFLVAAVYSENFKDVLGYFKYYQSIDVPSRELIKIFSAALFAAGKFYVGRQQEREAIECFTHGVIVVGPELVYLDNLIRELVKIRSGEAASQFLKKVPAEQVGGPVHSRLSFLISQFFVTKDDLIQRGRKLVQDGMADADSFRLLIKILVETNKKTLAEDIASKATQAYPDLRGEIYQEIAKLQ